MSDQPPAPSSNERLSGGSGSTPSLDDTHAATHDGREAAASESPPQLEPGESIGRYVVLGKLGAGSMGVVYLARDPELDRNVALKVLRPRADHERAEIGQRKLLAEAQALARLADPHVVAVYDVGASRGGVFVAMELIEGETLRAWCSTAPRSWRDVLGVLVQVGRGLAAVHTGELIHRDLKPDNVMIGRDGRVRVMDFGLARAASVRRVGEAGDAFSTAPLAIGAFVGTPSYSAPEQLSGRRVTAVSDQFSFCVTAWEALHGRRPFVADSVPGLVSRMLAGEIDDTPGDRPRPPRWLRKILRRGLSADPSARWPTMAALLDAIERGRSRASMQRLAISGLVPVVAIAAVVGGQRYARHRRLLACEDAAAAATSMWSPARAETIAAAVSRTGSTNAAATATHLVPSLERHAAALQRAHVEVCTATNVDHTWDADLGERATWCVNSDLDELAALLDELEGLDQRRINRAIEAVAGLSPGDSCTDPIALDDVLVPPADLRTAAREVRRTMAQRAALAHLGDYETARAVADATLERAIAVGWPPLVAEARLASAGMHAMTGDLDGVEAALEQAYFEAAREGDDLVSAGAASELVDVVGEKLGRPLDALRWTNHLEVALLRVSDSSAIAAGALARSRGSISQSLGKLTVAKGYYEQAIAELQARNGPDHPETIDTRGEYAALLSDLGEHALARAENEAVLAVREATLGPDHPKVGMSLTNLARDLRALGHVREAIVGYERAIAIWEGSLGPDHLHVAQALNNLGNAVGVRGDLVRAEALHRKALAIRERAVGPDNPAVAQSLGNLANLAMLRLDFAAAVASSERALAILEGSVGAEHPQAAVIRVSLGKALAATDALERSETVLRRAIEVFDASGTTGNERAAASFTLATTLAQRGKLDEAARELDVAERTDEHDFLRADVLTARADIAHRRGDAAAASDLAGRALDAWAAGEMNAAVRPVAELALARMLLDRTRAREVEQHARAALAATNQPDPAKIDAYLAALDP